VIIKGSQPLTTLEPQALLKVLKGKHIYYKLVQKNSSIQRTKPIYWSEIKLHNQWTLEILVALPKIEKKNAIDDLKYITKKKKKKDGTVNISFQPFGKSLFNLFTSQRLSPLRNSFNE
jgi:hypothetical protein